MSVRKNFGHAGYESQRIVKWLLKDNVSGNRDIATSRNIILIEH